MENQHQKIKGYRDLTKAEIDLMNQIKVKGLELQALIRSVDGHLATQSGAAAQVGDADELDRIESAQPRRWVAIATTDLQTGLMALTRAVAQPTTF